MIEFIEETHTYLVEGVITPSVSEILRSTIFKDQYKDVPSYIMKQASEFGTNVHLAIETDNIDNLNSVELACYEQNKKIEERYGFKVIDREQVVHYKDYYCGTFDCIIEIDGNLYLNDYKTTYKLNREYLSWQMSFYKVAWEWLNGKALKGGYATWLPKKKLGEFVEIELKSKEEVLDLYRQYKEIQNEG